MNIVAGTLANDELYISLISRVSAFNNVSCERLIHRHTKLRTVTQLRDYGDYSEEFCQSTAGLCGTPLEIVRKGSLSAFYSGSGHWGPKYKMTPWRKHIRPAHLLRVCPDCFGIELQEIGVAFWHKLHQLPLTSVCLNHRQRLIEVTCNDGPRMPQISDIELGVFCGSQEHFEVLYRLAEAEKNTYDMITSRPSALTSSPTTNMNMHSARRDTTYINKKCATVRNLFSGITGFPILHEAIQWPRLEISLSAYLESHIENPDPIALTITNLINANPIITLLN